MDKAELKELVINEMLRQQSEGHFPNTSNYMKYKHPDAPSYVAVIRLLKPMKWADLIRESGVVPTQTQSITRARRSWVYYTPEYLLDKALERMHELDRLTYQTYEQERGTEAPAAVTLMKRLNCTWNDIIAKYIERYGHTDNLKKDRNVSIPLSRYNELVEIERKYKEGN